MRSLLLLLLGMLVIAATPAAAQENLLQNASFDSEVYTPVSFDPAAQSVYLAVPQGWGGAVIQSPRTEPWMNVHPTGLPHTGGIKVDGFRSYHVARGGGTFTAFIYQQVSVEPGTPVQGGAWVYIEGATGIARVGIDPNGGTNPFAPGIAWAETAQRFGWSTPTVGATAGDTGVVTLFLFATQGAPANPNGVYWDAAFLNGSAGTTPPPADAPPAAAATGDPILRATVGRLNVRVSNNASARILGIISPENRYAVLGEAGGWYRINYGGQEGWVSGDYVRIDTNGGAIGGAPVTSDITYTTNAPLRIRSGPTTNAEIISRIPWGGTAAVIGRNAAGTWVQVNYDGVTGWSAVGYGSINGDINALPVVG